MPKDIEERMLSAVQELVGNPELHARTNRISHALLAVASVEDPNPQIAVGLLLGSSVEYMHQLGFSRKQMLDFAASLFDMLDSAEGKKLRDATIRNQG